MVKTEADGQLVNIPARRQVTDGVTDQKRKNGLMVFHWWLEGCCAGKSAQLTLMWSSEQPVGSVFTEPSLPKRVPRKTSKGLRLSAPYRKPTQVDRASSPRGTSDFSLRNSAKKRS